jgi:glycosyltransferase involved in cell wall biosynthesis
MPKITVSINAYNSMPFLKDAVASILNQSLQDFDFVIVNDGSTDGTSAYLDSLTDPRIRIIHQENRGTAAASNRVIESCQTEYIVRMDADDISLPNRLQILLEYMENHPNVGMAGSQAVWFGEHGSSKNLKLPTSHAGIRSALMSGHHAIVHPTVIQRTSVIRGIGGYWKYREYDDEYDMMLRMGEAAEVVNLDKILYRYRIVPGSLSGASPKRVRFSIEYTIELAKRRADGRPAITADEFKAILNARPWWVKVVAASELYGRTQYRKAVFEMFNNKPIIGRARLAWASVCAPLVTIQRIKRILRPSKQS